MHPTETATWTEREDAAALLKLVTLLFGPPSGSSETGVPGPATGVADSRKETAR